MDTLTRILGWILAAVMLTAIVVFFCEGISCLLRSGNEPTILRGGFTLLAAALVGLNLATVLKSLLVEEKETVSKYESFNRR